MKQLVEVRKDIVFFLKMYPLVSIHPHAYNEAKVIVCQKDNNKAVELLERAYDKKELPKPSCNTDIIDRNLELGRKLGVDGTPTLIFQSGRKVSGALTVLDLLKFIETDNMADNDKSRGSKIKRD